MTRSSCGMCEASLREGSGVGAYPREVLDRLLGEAEVARLARQGRLVPCIVGGSAITLHTRDDTVGDYVEAGMRSALAARS